MGNHILGHNQFNVAKVVEMTMHILSKKKISVPGNVDFDISGMTSRKLCNSVATYCWISSAEYKYERHSIVT